MQIAINNKKLVQDCSIEIANIHSLLSFSLFLVCTLGSEREERLHVGVAPIETIETYKSRC